MMQTNVFKTVASISAANLSQFNELTRKSTKPENTLSGEKFRSASLLGDS
ncbi:Hypothetical protein FKW44_014571 [Caligus rogercresseyi]|uniref:Uncharacterized protein n=1 Tax=Caligus rogercresseyi TaxID=217165 RepID=A0A7T8GZS9_CALRO|nr:Hypothetical protein FKW44_014571 [Caligus rogercresseyi]